MTQETLGYVELEWTCKHCGGKNPGTEKKCRQCGAPMYQQTEFELPDQAELITDEEEIRKASTSRPDIHCPYCETRNPASATQCKQCGGDLTKGEARKRGGVLGAAPAAAAAQSPPAAKPKKKPKRKPRRATKRSKTHARPATSAVKPAKKGLSLPAIITLGIMAVILACVVGFFFLATVKTKDVQGIVQDVVWTRSILVEGLQTVSDEGWRDEIPSGARIGFCQEKFRYTQSEPASGPDVRSEKVCGTPYVLDQGEGRGKVVRDCEYKIYADWCHYTRDEWQVLYTETASEHDLKPYWPQVRLQASQREGKRTEKYEVVFGTEEKSYRYYARDAAAFAQFTEGSKWKLTINALGGVKSVEPAR